VDSVAPKDQIGAVTTFRSWLLAAGLMLAAVACAAPVQQRSVYRSYRATRLPPALIYEAATVQPYAGAVWIPGYWDWDGFDWVWIPGHWELAPAGYVWIGPSYSPFGGYCDYTPGSWRRSGTVEVERVERAPAPAPAPVPSRGVARTADRPVAPKPQIAPRVREQPTHTAKPPPAARLQPAPARRDLNPQIRSAPPPRQLQPARVAPPSQQQTPPVVKPAPKPNNNTTTSPAPLKSGSKPSKK
jgi:hypothetical protein